MMRRCKIPRVIELVLGPRRRLPRRGKVRVAAGCSKPRSVLPTVAERGGARVIEGAVLEPEKAARDLAQHPLVLPTWVWQRCHEMCDKHRIAQLPPHIARVLKRVAPITDAWFLHLAGCFRRPCCACWSSSAAPKSGEILAAKPNKAAGYGGPVCLAHVLISEEVSSPQFQCRIQPSQHTTERKRHPAITSSGDLYLNVVPRRRALERPAGTRAPAPGGRGTACRGVTPWATAP
jgi:hypothetical protein